jgi:hypothetical protein
VWLERFSFFCFGWFYFGFVFGFGFSIHRDISPIALRFEILPDVGGRKSDAGVDGVQVAKDHGLDQGSGAWISLQAVLAPDFNFHNPLGLFFQTQESVVVYLRGLVGHACDLICRGIGFRLGAMRRDGGHAFIGQHIEFAHRISVTEKRGDIRWNIGSGLCGLGGLIGAFAASEHQNSNQG